MWKCGQPQLICGGLKHVFNKTFRFLKALEMIAYVQAANETNTKRVCN